MPAPTFDYEQIDLDYTESAENELVLSWTLEGFQATAFIDLVNYQTRIQYHDAAADHGDEFMV